MGYRLILLLLCVSCVREWNTNHAYRAITYDKNCPNKPLKDIILGGFLALDLIFFALNNNIIRKFTVLKELNND